ncbi:ROK family transcriptional regulator [Sphingomonas sp. dw_22]|uniref:ROK family transcriptional regulator n=1 Tax=Sphingomonas sp. dw_22 TaxID=2721175 RepID=UPI001BD2D0DD
MCRDSSGRKALTAKLNLSANERRLIDLVWRRGPIARTDLAGITGLTGASVTRMVRTLNDLGLVEETVNRVGARGQPTRPVHINRSGAQAIGVYFSHRHAEIGLIDLGGTILHAETRVLENADPAALGALAASFIADVEARGLTGRDRLLGVGVAVPADFIDGVHQLHAHAYFPELARRDALRDFAAAVPVPVYVENDAASAALGERILGAAQNLDSFIFVHIGHGVGGGIMMDGRLIRGARGNAGMIGIQFPNDRPRPSGQDLFATLAREGIAVDDFADLEALSVQSCAPLRAWIKRAGGQLREQLGITARLFDPEAVLLGGRLPLPLLHALLAEVNVPGFCDEGVGLPQPRVAGSMLGVRAGLVGAASLPIYRVLLDWREDEDAAPGLLLG